MMTLPLDLSYVAAYEQTMCRAYAFWRTVISSARRELAATAPRTRFETPSRVLPLSEPAAPVEAPKAPDSQIALMKLALEIANKDISDKEEIIRDLRAGMDAIRSLLAELGVPCEKGGLLPTLRTALTTRSSTAPHAQHEAGEVENDHSAAQIAPAPTAG